MVRLSSILLLFCISHMALSMSDDERNSLQSQIKSIQTIEDRIESVEQILQLPKEVDAKVAAVEATRFDAQQDDFDTICEFYTKVGDDRTLDDAIRSMAYKSLFRVKQAEFKFESASRYIKQAYDLQPTRTDSEMNQKSAMLFLIAEDMRDRGEFESALKHFIEYCRLYPHPSSQQLQLFTYFENIPNLTKLIPKERGDSSVVESILQDGLHSNQPGERFGAAMIQFGQSDFSSAIETAQQVPTLSDEPRWKLYADMVHAAVLFLNEEQHEMKEILNALTENPKNDNWMTFFVRIMAMTSSDIFDQPYEKSFSLYEWYLQSPIFLDESRQRAVSSGSVAHILQGYAIDMMHFNPVTFPNKRDESFAFLTRIYEDYYDQFSGKSSGLIIAEDLIKKEKFDEAEKIITRIQNDVEDDNYLKSRTLLVLAQLHEARGDLISMGLALQQVSRIPERKGNDDFKRLKNDSYYFFENNMALQVLAVSLSAIVLVITVVSLRYLFHYFMTIDLEK